MPRASRALTATGILLVTALSLAATPAQAHEDTARRTATYDLQAREADSVVDGYGVGIHTGFFDTPYKDADAVAAAIKDLGVRHVRDDLFLHTPQQYQAIQQVYDAGARFDLIMGRPGQGDTPADFVKTVADQLPAGSVESLEGANEWDLFGPQDTGDDGQPMWVGQVRDWQQQLWDSADADPATADLPVLSPALAFKWDYQALGDVSADSDIANMHLYPGGNVPSTEIGQMTAAVRSSVPDGPLITTEAGYHNATSATGSHPGVTEAVAAAYLPRLLLEHLARGEQRMYGYELIDEFDNPALDDPEAHFGLLHHDLTPKPGYAAMKNLLGLLADPGPSFQPGSLHLTADGFPDDRRYLLTQKRGGEFVLLLWRDAPVTVDPVDVTLSVPTVDRIRVFRPTDGTDPVQDRIGSSVTLPLDGEVTAITFDPSDATRPDAPSVRASSPAPHRVVVRWHAAEPHGSPVTSYRVVVAGEARTVAAGARRAVFRHLPSKRVKVSVRAHNALGWGPPGRTSVRVR